MVAAVMLTCRRRRFWRALGGLFIDLAVVLVGAGLIAALVLAVHGTGR
jgi:hypothetical protein